MTPDPMELVILQSEAGQRLDRILAARDLGHSRSTLQRWMAEGRVDLDGQPAGPRLKPVAGARVQIRPAPPPPLRAEPQDIPLEVVHEDEAILVVNKPGGLVVHPAAGHPDGTLVNAVLFRLGAMQAGDPERPGIVHRLDKDTSGVMVVAKTEAAHAALVAQFKTHDIRREYVALVRGRPPGEVSYDTLHGRHPGDRKRFSSKVREGKRAVTHLRVLEPLHGSALVACRLETGRTHQIRVHLCDHGHPVLADPVYGRASADPRLRQAVALLGRQALHARLLGFRHPASGEAVVFEVEMPDEIEAALQSLREPGAGQGER